MFTPNLSLARGVNRPFFAPDIILDVDAENRNPERAAQIYANNRSRVNGEKSTCELRITRNPLPKGAIVDGWKSEIESGFIHLLLSKRSIVATMVFMGAAAATVFVVRHVAGASW